MNYHLGNKNTYNTVVLKSNLCDYSNFYILVGGDINIIGYQVTQVSFGNGSLVTRWCWRFRFDHANIAQITKCITKVDGTTIDDAENLDLTMPI